MSLLCGCGNEEQAIKCVYRERSESLVPSRRALRVSCSTAHVICLVFPPCCGHGLPALGVKLLSVCLQWMGDWSELQKSFLKLRHDQCLVNIGLIYQVTTVICQVIHKRLVSRHLHRMRVPFVSALAPLREWHIQTVPMECEPREGTLQCCFMLLGAGEGQLMQEGLFIFPTQCDRSVCFPQSYIPRFLCDCIQPKSAVERSSPSPWCSHWSIAFWEKLLKSK